MRNARCAASQVIPLIQRMTSHSVAKLPNVAQDRATWLQVTAVAPAKRTRTTVASVQPDRSPAPRTTLPVLRAMSESSARLPWRPSVPIAMQGRTPRRQELRCVAIARPAHSVQLPLLTAARVLQGSLPRKQGPRHVMIARLADSVRPVERVRIARQASTARLPKPQHRLAVSCVARAPTLMSLLLAVPIVPRVLPIWIPIQPQPAWSVRRASTRPRSNRAAVSRVRRAGTRT